MLLSEATLKALDAWIKTSTWYKTNEQDNHRFYRFVHQLAKDDGYFDNVQGLTNFISGRIPVSSGLQTVLNYKIELADQLVEYQRYINSLG